MTILIYLGGKLKIIMNAFMSLSVDSHICNSDHLSALCLNYYAYPHILHIFTLYNAFAMKHLNESLNGCLAIS